MYRFVSRTTPSPLPPFAGRGDLICWFRVVLLGLVCCAGIGSADAQSVHQKIERISGVLAAREVGTLAQSGSSSAGYVGVGAFNPVPLASVAAATPEASAESPESLPLGRGSSVSVSSERGGENEAGFGGRSWVLTTLTAMGVILAIIYGGRMVMTRLGGVTRVTTSPAVEVLSRTSIAPRHHVLLLRVAGRVLVVSDGPQGSRSLAEISDPSEVASILESVSAQSPKSPSAGFGQVMNRVVRGMDEPAQGWTEPAVGKAGKTRHALGQLRGRIHSMQASGESVG